MNNIKLKISSPLEYTTISNTFIDNYMPQANGEFVKVYLYLLRCLADPYMNISLSAIADKFNQTEKDVVRALRYFSSINLLSVEFDNDGMLSEITVLQNINPSSQNSDNSKELYNSPNTTGDYTESNTNINTYTEATDYIPDTTNLNQIPDKPSYSTFELKSFNADEDFKELMYIVQKFMGKPLSNSECGSVIYMYDSLKMSCDLIEYVVDYCISNGHPNMYYIEKVAIDWASANIKTVSEAKEYSSRYSKNTYSVMRAFGINGRNPGDIERKYIDTWFNTYNFEADIVVEACNRTMQSIQKPSFEYTDSILKSWHNKGVLSLADIKKLDLAHSNSKQSSQNNNSNNNSNSNGNYNSNKSSTNKFNNYNQHTYDFDKLEQILNNK